MKMPAPILIVLAIVSFAVLAIGVNACSRAVFPEVPGVPKFSVADVETAEENGVLIVTVSLSRSYSVDCQVSYQTSDDSDADFPATAGTDYTAVSGTLSFPSGTTSRTVSVTILDDSEDEGDEETFLFQIFGATAGAAVKDAEAVCTINDATDIVALYSVALSSATPAPVNEGATGELTEIAFTVSLDRAILDIGTVNYTITDGTAEDGSDFRGSSGTLTFQPGDVSEDLVVLINGDDVPEGNETFTVTISVPLPSIITDIGTASVIATITDDDGAAQPTTLYVDTPAMLESGNVLTFTVTADSAPAADVEFTYETTGGTADTGGADYSPVTSPTTVTILAGTTSITFTLTLVDDNDLETNETVEVTLTETTGTHVFPGLPLGTPLVVTGTILNDDEPYVGVTGGGIMEPSTTGATRELQIAIDLVDAAGAPTTWTDTVMVDWDTGDGDARAIDNDYTTESGTAVFYPGETTKYFTITVKSDREWEPNESFTVTLSNNDGNPNSGILPAMTTADCVIVDDEPGFDFDGDDRMDLALVAPKYDEGATDDVGRVYIFYGQISGDLDGAAALGSADGPDVIISGDDADDRLSKVTAGDFNGDGLDDLAVSSPYVAGGAPAGSGMVFIYFGNTPDGSGNKQIGQANASDTHVALDTGSSADVVIRHEDFAGQLGLGSDIVCPGDINGDGYEDLVIADERYDSDTMADPPNIGRVYIFYGGPDFVGSKIASDADVTIIGDTTDNTYFGISVGRAGDVNGDGLADVLAGAWLYDGAAYIPPPTSTDDIYYGAGYLFYGDRDLPGSMGVNGTLGDDDQPAVRIVGPNTADLLGRHVTGVGDVNNDGFDDFSVSSYWAPYSGTSQLWDFTGIIYLFYGSATLGSTNPTPGLYDDLAGATPASVTFESDAFINTSTNVVGEGMGYAVSKIGDYDGDDIDDLAISAVGWSRADAPPTNTEVSAPSGSSNVPPGRGRVYIIKGGTTNFPATVANYGTSNVSNTTSVQTVSYVILEGDDDAVTAANGREEMGKFISGVGDLDGDGTMDIAISSTFTALDSSTDESTGQVYLLLGNSAQPSPVDLNVAHTQFSSYVWTVAAARVGQGTGTDPEEYETGDLFGNCIAK